jgi:hypothetical protein
MQRHVLAVGYVNTALKGQHRMLVTQVQAYGGCLYRIIFFRQDKMDGQDSA